MKETVKEKIQWICKQFNLEVLGNFKDADDTILVVFRHKGNLKVSPIYITADGETLIKSQEAFYEVTTYEIQELF